MEKIAVNTVENFIKEHKQDKEFVVNYPIGDTSFDVTVKTYLSVIERGMFINRVVSNCFDANGNYTPEYFEPLFRATVLQMTTNLPVLTLKEDANEEGSFMDIDAMNELWYALNAEELFYANANFCIFFSELFNECREELSRRMNERRFNEVLNKLNGFEEIGELISNAKSAFEVFAELGSNKDFIKTLDNLIAMQGEVSDIKS